MTHRFNGMVAILATASIVLAGGEGENKKGGEDKKTTRTLERLANGSATQGPSVSAAAGEGFTVDTLPPVLGHREIDRQLGGSPHLLQALDPLRLEVSDRAGDPENDRQGGQRFKVLRGVDTLELLVQASMDRPEDIGRLRVTVLRADLEHPDRLDPLPRWASW